MLHVCHTPCSPRAAYQLSPAMRVTYKLTKRANRFRLLSLSRLIGQVFSFSVSHFLAYPWVNSMPKSSAPLIQSCNSSFAPRLHFAQRPLAVSSKPPDPDKPPRPQLTTSIPATTSHHTFSTFCIYKPRPTCTSPASHPILSPPPPATDHRVPSHPNPNHRSQHSSVLHAQRYAQRPSHGRHAAVFRARPPRIALS